jgi:hypothetical protein
MKTIIEQKDFVKISNRIRLLSSTNKKRWGKMTLQEMLVHCTTQLKLALGEIESSAQGSFIMRTAFGKWIAFSNIPWPQGSNTPSEMNVEKNRFMLTDIENEKKDLLTYLDRVMSASELMPHPFFGQLTKTEWSRLIFKHIDHHLKQFSQ